MEFQLETQILFYLGTQNILSYVEKYLLYATFQLELSLVKSISLSYIYFINSQSVIKVCFYKQSQLFSSFI